MNDAQMNKLRMYRKVNGVANTYQTAIGKYAPILNANQAFEGNLSQIEEVLAAQEGTQDISAEEKEGRKESMALECSELAAAGFVYAKESGNTALQSVLEVSYSEVRYTDDQSAYNTARAVCSALKEVQPDLEAYMISADDLAKLDGLVEGFKLAMKSTSGQDSVARTRQLAGLFKKTSEYLRDHLDKLMMRVRRKEPVLYDAYTNARVIVDLGGEKKKEQEAVLEA